jgi:hypothetical protein
VRLEREHGLPLGHVELEALFDQVLDGLRAGGGGRVETVRRERERGSERRRVRFMKEKSG